jgi:hypothetical protein
LAWKIKVDSVAVPRAMFSYEDENGNKKYHHVSKVYTRDQIVPDELVSPLIQQLYEDGDEHTQSVYEKVAEDEKESIPPFDGYDDLDESGVRALMVNMRSEDIQRVKSYERDNQNRESIVDYVVGFGEAPKDRLEGTVPGQSDYQKSEVSDPKNAVKPKASGAAEKEVSASKESDKAEQKQEDKPQQAKSEKRSSSKKQSNNSEE